MRQVVFLGCASGDVFYRDGASGFHSDESGGVGAGDPPTTLARSAWGARRERLPQ